MNVLSLFDGMSCGRIALDRANIPVTNYYASEIDKYAIKVSEANYPDIVRLGDVKEVRALDLPKIDLLLAGSPCQGFSFAGKQLNFDDPRSALFWEFVRLLKSCKPKYFLLENVKMKKEYQNIISEAVGVEPVLINSTLFSAQSRPRLYWSNLKIESPIDKKITLADIVEEAVDIKYFLSQEIVNGSLTKKGEWGFRFKPHTPIDKSYCLTSRYYKMGKSDPYIDTLSFYGGFEKGRRIPGDKILSRNYGEGYRVYNEEGKAACLTSSSKGGCGYTGSYRIRTNIRKLTPVECERLQTVPDNYTNHVSNTQRYKMLGNGWTVDVIAHILKGIK